MRIGHATTAIKLATLPVIAGLETRERGVGQEKVVVMTETEDQEAQDAETQDLVPDLLTAAKRSALKIVRVAMTDVVVAGGKMVVNKIGEILASTTVIAPTRVSRKIGKKINHKTSDR